MNPPIAAELDRIPGGGLAQNLYRSANEQARFNAGRHAEIGPEPSDAHALALQVVRPEYPDFSPEMLA